MLPRTAANDQLLGEEGTCIYFNTCLVLKDFKWNATWRGLAGAHPLAKAGLPEGYTVNSTTTLLQYHDLKGYVHKVPLLQSSKKAPKGPSSQYVGKANSTLLWDPLYAYYGRPLWIQPVWAKVGTVSTLPLACLESTSVATETRRKSADGRDFAARTALKPKGSESSLFELSNLDSGRK